MSGTDIAAIIAAVTACLATIAKGFSWVINILIDQYKSTTSTQRETIEALTTERDTWKARAYAAGWKEGS